MRGWLRDNGLSVFFLALFLGALVAQAIAGWQEYNNDEIAHARLMDQQPETLSLGRYVTSSSFGQALMENWQSEYLQFVLFILAAVWFVQKGSPESKSVKDVGRETDEQQAVGEHAKPGSPKWAKVGGIRTAIYSNSLLIVMGLIWAGSWFAQSVTGWSTNNAERIEHEEAPLSWLEYVGSASFWENTLQNWQSEFLAVGSFAIFTVYLRQRGSAQSKPVGAAHSETAVDG
jgi:uncharacterized protein DUF6766